MFNAKLFIHISAETKSSNQQKQTNEVRPSILSSDGELQVSEQFCPPTDQPPIPKIFHRMWINFGKGEEPSNEYQNLTERLMKLHPGWRYILWHEQKIITAIKEHVPFFLHTFESYDKPIKKHDSARMVILYAMGGVYLDHDVIPIKSIEPALGTCRFFGVSGFLKDGKKFGTNNDLMGSVAKNPFLMFAIKMMNSPEIAKLHVLHATGPDLLGNALKEYIREEHPTGFKIYHPKFFALTFQVTANALKENGLNATIEEIKSRAPDCIFAHYFLSSWMVYYINNTNN